MTLTDPTLLQPTVDWLRNFLRDRHDLSFTTVVHRPPFWLFYDADGDFVVKMEEELLERTHFALNRDHFTLGEPEPLDQLAELFRDETPLVWEDDDDMYGEDA